MNMVEYHPHVWISIDYYLSVNFEFIKREVTLGGPEQLKTGVLNCLGTRAQVY